MHGDMVIATGYPVMVVIVVAGVAQTDVCIVLLLIDMFDSRIMMKQRKQVRLRKKSISTIIFKRANSCWLHQILKQVFILIDLGEVEFELIHTTKQ